MLKLLTEISDTLKRILAALERDEAARLSREADQGH